MTATLAPRPTIRQGREYSFPTADEWHLDNGLRVVHLPVPGRLLKVLLTTFGGADCEPEGQEGLATLVTRLRGEGTAARDAQQFSAAVDALGARYSAGTSHQAATAGMTVPASHLDAALSLLAETASEPAFTLADVEQQRRLQLDQLRQTLSLPGGAAEAALAEALYASGDRRSTLVLGTPASLPALDQDAVRAFAASRLAPGSTALTVAGACSREQIESALASSLARWESSPDAVRTVPSPRAPQPGARRVVLVDRPSAVQTEIRLATVTAGRTDATWAPLTVAAHVLGGSMGSRLSAVLREQKGYTYGVTARLVPTGASGQFVVSTAVDAENTEPALADLCEVVELMAGQGVGETEAHEAVAERLGREGLQMQTAQAMAATVDDYVEHGLPVDWSNTHRTAMRAVSAHDASAAFEALDLLGRSAVVLVGPVDRIEPAVRRALPDAEISVQ
ncbi:M16 family metallopeptidase [Streptomyces sp. NPDC091217]|uniref:M16 family metallopeptidase n=1 Tax=Streptomyces sp. NPDC091217 TaxID=3365975 RepID=UPI003815E44A